MKFAAYLLAGLGLGLGFAYWQTSGDPVGDWSSGISIEDGAPLDRRLSELETSLRIERYEREALAEELAELRAALAPGPQAADAVVDESRTDPRERFAALVESGDAAGPVLDRMRERMPNGFGGFDEASREQRQIERFLEAGLTAERAQWILAREDELQMEVLDAQYEARRSGASAEEVAALSTGQFMRDELGDADYEKYLDGLGRPTSINIRDVLTNSPAQAAGLAPGDEIVGYNGNRVFDMNELNSLTLEASPGTTVAIDVLRDGQQIQLYVDGGPIGVSGGGRSTRRRR